MISLNLAPTAFLKPISLVLSETTTYITFKIPTPPTIKETMTIKSNSIVIPFVIVSVISSISLVVITLKSSLSGSEIL